MNRAAYGGLRAAPHDRRSRSSARGRLILLTSWNEGYRNPAPSFQTIHYAIFLTQNVNILATAVHGAREVRSPSANCRHKSSISLKDGFAPTFRPFGNPVCRSERCRSPSQISFARRAKAGDCKPPPDFALQRSLATPPVSLSKRPASFLQYSSAFHPIHNTLRASGSLSEDIVDDAWDGTRRVDIDAGGKVFPGIMVAEYQRALCRLEARLIWPPI